MINSLSNFNEFCLNTRDYSLISSIFSYSCKLLIHFLVAFKGQNNVHIGQNLKNILLIILSLLNCNNDQKLLLIVLYSIDNTSYKKICRLFVAIYRTVGDSDFQLRNYIIKTSIKIHFSILVL